MDTQLTLPESALILTVTRRLALRLQQGILDKKRPQQAASIYALNDWFHQLWQHIQVRGITGGLALLTPIQEKALWLSIIESSDYGAGLLRPHQTAQQLASSFKLLQQWQLSLNDIDWGGNEEGLIFKEWAQAFLNTLEQKQWISHAQLPDVVRTKLFEHESLLKTLLPFEQICFTGFDDIPPQIQAWITTLEEKAKQVITFEQKVEPDNITRYEFKDIEHEFYHVANDAFEWAQNNEGVYAIVVPELLQTRAKVENIFNEVCDKQACLNPEFEVSWQYNISAGLALSEYPIIHAAFESIKLLSSSVELNTLLYILDSPFFKASTQEQASRARLAYQIKQLQKPNLSLDEILALDLSDVPVFKEMLRNVKSFVSQWTDRKSIHQWQTLLVKWFEHIDWPGDRRLNSPEHQVVQRFYAALNTWAELDGVAEPMSSHDALNWLSGLCFETSFQPESNPVKIQIMGLLEASGQRFDKLWVTGLNSEAWPAKPAPNAFLPMDLQIKHNMPHASAIRELEFAQHLTQTLSHSADKVCFSHALNDEGKTFHPSPLIDHLPLEQPEYQSHKTLELAVRQSAVTEPRMDDEPIALLKDEPVSSGSGIIKAQSECPFKAFATYRLHCDEPGVDETGITSLERGNLLHQVLQLVWQQLGDHQTLVQTSQESRLALLDKIIDGLGAQVKQDKPFFWAIEKRRLKMLISSWLTLEQERSPFKVVKSEVNVQVALEGMTLNCWIDRVDITDTGEPVIIDYKTGQAAIKDCFGERPFEPQLPIYCFANFPTNPKGIVFAKVRRDGCQFVGVTENADMLPGVSTLEQLNVEDVPTDWHLMLSNWKSILDDISQEFVKGEHSVTPTSARSCAFCDLQSLCRVTELADA